MRPFQVSAKLLKPNTPAPVGFTLSPTWVTALELPLSSIEVLVDVDTI